MSTSIKVSERGDRPEATMVSITFRKVAFFIVPVGWRYTNMFSCIFFPSFQRYGSLPSLELFSLLLSFFPVSSVKFPQGHFVSPEEFCDLLVSCLKLDEYSGFLVLSFDSC